MSLRVRFAPSPTGKLHLGNVRTAIYNWLYARKNNGVFILRIEDTDAERSTDDSIRGVLEDLKWLGVDWDEGPEAGGSYGPYRQTERYDIYQRHLDRLLKEGKAYPCYCSQEELNNAREQAKTKNQNYIYAGTCRRLSEDQKKEKESGGLKPSFRLRVTPQMVSFKDLIRGDVSIHTAGFGDFIIVRPDLSPTYNFAVVIDDSLMKVSDVIRGEDHLPNTPKQILLYEAFGYDKPNFAHLSMILGPDGGKLSKRHGDVSVQAFREKGFLPEGLMNGLALLGWSDVEEKEILTVEELKSRFDIGRVNKSAAIFDEGKFRHLNKEHIMTLPREAFAEKISPYFADAGLIPESTSGDNYNNWLLKLAELVQKRIHLLPEAVTAADPVFHFDPASMDDESRSMLESEEALKVVLTFAEKSGSADLTTRESYIALINEIKNELKVKGKNLYHPLRLCVTATASGPDLDLLVPVMELGSRLDLPNKIESPAKRAWRFVSYLREQGYKI
jgi:nondiscriminating glutamyl-tRNA synthetase